MSTAKAVIMWLNSILLLYTEKNHYFSPLIGFCGETSFSMLETDVFRVLSFLG